MTLLETLRSEHIARHQRLWNYRPAPIKPDPVPEHVEKFEEEHTDSEIAQKVGPTLVSTERLPTVREVQHVVCRHFKISYADIISPRRDIQTVQARHVAMWLCRYLTPNSLPQIGRRFGARDHTTVMHAVNKINGKREFDRELAELLENLKAEISDLVARGSIISEVK